MLSISVVVIFVALVTAAIVCRALHREEILARVAVVAVAVAIAIALIPLASPVIGWGVVCCHHNWLVVLERARLLELGLCVVIRQQAMSLETVQVHSQVLRLLLRHVAEEALMIEQLRVVGIVPPRRDLNAVARLAHKVLPNVVNDDYLGQVASNERQVLNVVARLAGHLVLDLHGVLPVEPVCD